MHTGFVRQAKDLNLVKQSSIPTVMGFTMNADESSLHVVLNDLLSQPGELLARGAVLKDADFPGNMEASTL